MARDFDGSNLTRRIAVIGQWLRCLARLHHAWSRDWGGWLTLASALYLVVYQAWTIQPWGGEEHRSFVGNLACVPLSLVAVALTARASRHPRLDESTRRGWVLMTLAQLGYLAGNLLWIHAELILGVEPFPSWSDVGYLAFYPLVFLAILIFPKREQSRDERLRFGLDVATILVGSSMVVWHFLLRPLALDETSDPLAATLSISYIVGDLVLVFGIVMVLLRRPARASRAALWLTIVGLALFLVADVAFAILEPLGAYQTGDWPDGLWGGAIYFMLLGARYQWWRAAEEHGEVELEEVALPRWTQGLPYVAVAAGFGLLLLVTPEQAPEPLMNLVAGAAALTGLVIVRQVILLKENARLLAQRSTLTETLARREARSRLAAECASDLIYEWHVSSGRLEWFGDIDGRLGYAPGAFPRTLAAWEAIIHPEDRARVLEALERHQEAGSLFVEEYRVLSRDGRELVWLDRGMPLAHGSGAPTTFVGVTTDITERKRAETQLAHQAFHDALTGLPNRALLGDHLARALAGARRQERQVALLFLDLDNFKLVNDTLGHEAGDHVLIDVATRLRNSVRAGDTVARHGGDEFIVLMTDLVEPGETAVVAERVLAHLREPFRVAGQEFTLSASIGIALSNGWDDGLEDLLRGADAAVYHAKRVGKACYQVFEPSMIVGAAERRELEHELRHALEHSEFEARYQPIIHRGH